MLKLWLYLLISFPVLMFFFNCGTKPTETNTDVPSLPVVENAIALDSNKLNDLQSGQVITVSVDGTDLKMTMVQSFRSTADTINEPILTIEAGPDTTVYFKKKNASIPKMLALSKFCSTDSLAGTWRAFLIEYDTTNYEIKDDDANNIEIVIAFSTDGGITIGMQITGAPEIIYTPPSPAYARYLVFAYSGETGYEAPMIAYSLTGDNWYELPLCGNSGAATTANDSGVLWAASQNPATKRIVTVGETKANCGFIFYSDDKVTWTSTNVSSTSPRLLSVAYGNGRWVAVGYYHSFDGTTITNTGEILVSTDDGLTWAAKGPFTADTTPASEPRCRFQTVMYNGAGTWLAGGMNLLYSSNDNGDSWIPLSHDSISDALFINSLAYRDSTWYAATGDWWVASGMYGRIYSKHGTEDWVQRYSDGAIVLPGPGGMTYSPVNALISGPECLIAVAGFGWGKENQLSIITSADGINWVSTSVPGVLGAGLGICADPDGFIAMSSSGGIVKLNSSGTNQTVIHKEAYGGHDILAVP